MQNPKSEKHCFLRIFSASKSRLLKNQSSYTQFLPEVSNQENQLNRKKSKNMEYEFVDSLPEDLTIEIKLGG